MSYQFAHFEMLSRKVLVKPSDKATKSKKWNIKETIDEATRRNPDACLHVENPGKPVLVFGQDLEALEREHERACDGAVDVQKNGKSRKIRSTQNTMACIVLSWPGEMGEDCKRWQSRSIKWLKDTYGDQLKTVIRHDDEAFPHLHAFIVPDDLKAISLHPGDSAKQKAKADGLSPKEQNEAYKQSFRDWQDSYWDKVGKPSGLTRIGPGRRRLTRDQWNQEKQQAKALAIALADGREVSKRVDVAKAKAEKFEKLATVSGSVGVGVANAVESFTKSRFDAGAKSRENEIHLLKTQNEKLKSSNSSLKSKIHKSSKSRKSLLNELKKEREKSFDKSKPFRDLQKKNEQLETYLGMVFDSLDSHGINPCPYIKTVYTLDDLMRDCDRIAKEWLESFQSMWEPQQQAKPQNKGSGYNR